MHRVTVVEAENPLGSGSGLERILLVAFEPEVREVFELALSAAR